MITTETETFGSEWIALQRLEMIRKTQHIIEYRLYFDEDTAEYILTYTHERKD